MTFFCFPRKLLASFVFFYSSSALAYWQLDAFLDIAGDTNAIRTEPKQGETQLTSGLDINHEHTGSQLQTAIDYRLSRQIYLEETTNDRSQNTGQASLNYQLRPNWQLNLFHESSETLTDSRERDIASNRQQRDTTYASSLYNMRFGAANTLGLQLHSSYTTEDNAPLNDNSRYGTSLFYTRVHSSAFSSQLTLASNHIDYKSNLSQDYRLHDLNYSLSFRSAKLNLQLGAGYNLINQEGQPDVDGTSTFAQVAYRPANNQSLDLNLNRRLTDSSTGLTTPGTPSNTPGTRAGGSNIEIATRIELNYQIQLSPLYSGFARYIYDDGELQNINRRDTNTTVTAGITRSLASAASLRVQLNQQIQKRRELNSERQTDEIRFAYTQRLTQRLNVNLDLGFSLEEESPRFNGIDSLENGFYLLRLTYQLY